MGKHILFLALVLLSWWNQTDGVSDWFDVLGALWICVWFCFGLWDIEESVSRRNERLANIWQF